MPTSGSGTMTPVGGGGVGSTLGLVPVHPLPRTLLPIGRYAEIMGISLPHFWQLQGAKAPLLEGCDDVWDQDARAWLTDTLLQAEGMISDELGTFPVLNWVTEERIRFGLPGARSDWLNAEVATRYGEVECYGTETLTLVHADAEVVYSNLDGDPLDREETAQIGVGIYADIPACAEPCDVAVFFRVADGAPEAHDPRFEIRPIKVLIDGSTMEIQAESSLFVIPALYNLTQADCAGTDDPNLWQWPFSASNLVSAVDVYCRTCSCRTPATLYWDGVCTCTGICQHATQLACAYSTDPRLGYFIPRPATWDGTKNVYAEPTYHQPPESVIVSYRAGFRPDPRNCRMDARLERAIVKLTNALLPKPPCGYCDLAQQRWELDRTPIDPLTPEAASLPWDLYFQGALEAWRIVKRMALGRGGKAGR